jgi:hypothetical protein
MDIEMIEEVGIVEYSKTEAALADLRERMANVEYDVTTVKGMDIAKKDRAEVRGLRTGLEAMRKQIKAPALAHCQLIDAEAKRITAELLKLEEPIDSQIKRREAELEAERVARELAERQRITAIHERIASITGYHALALECRTADRVQALLDKMEAVWVAFNHEDDFGEFGAEAQSAYISTGASLAAIIEQKRIEDAERAAVKAAQQAEADRLSVEKFATEVAAKKLADERAAFEAEQAAFRATQAAARAAEQAEREAGLQAIAEQAAAEASAQAERDLAAYQAAITVDVETVRPVIDAAMAQIFGEAGDAQVPAVVAEQPPIPTVPEMLWVLARHYKVHSGQVAEWLTDCADEIARFE